MQALSTFPPVSNRAWQVNLAFVMQAYTIIYDCLQSRHLSRRRTRQEDKEEEEYEEVNIEELSTVEDEEEKFVLPPIVEEVRVIIAFGNKLTFFHYTEESTNSIISVS